MTFIQDTLRPFGITRRYKGFKHTVFAIYLSVTEEDRMEAVTKEIYMETASHFGCKWTCVERNIRTAVSRAWQTNPQRLEQMAGYPLSGPPTSSEFIDIVSTYIIRNPPPRP